MPPAGLEMPHSTSPPANPIVYHIPLARLAAYGGRGLIVRSARPPDLVARWRQNQFLIQSWRNVWHLYPTGGLHWRAGVGFRYTVSEVRH